MGIMEKMLMREATKRGNDVPLCPTGEKFLAMIKLFAVRQMGAAQGGMVAGIAAGMLAEMDEADFEGLFLWLAGVLDYIISTPEATAEEIMKYADDLKEGRTSEPDADGDSPIPDAAEPHDEQGATADVEGAASASVG